MNTTIQIKRHTSTSTSYLSHVLEEGELFYDFKSNKFYIGDGVKAINALAPISGLVGPTGATGPRGANGAQGPMGPTGPQGAQGPRGEKGNDGTGVNVKTSANDCSKIGDAYIDNMGILQVLTKIVGTTKTFTPAGEIKGPKGDTGPTGATGPQGANGKDGKDGNDGKQGLQGIQGPTGPTGKGIELKPSRSACEKVGDAYIDSNGILWFLSALPDTFTQSGKIEGPKGDTGDTGPTGENGAQGVQGPMGPTGPQGIPGIDGEDGKDGDGRLITLNGINRGTTGPLSFYAPEYLSTIESSTASSLALYKNNGTVEYINPPSYGLWQSYTLHCGEYGSVSWKPEYNYFEYNPDNDIKSLITQLLSAVSSSDNVPISSDVMTELYNSLEKAVLGMSADFKCAQCYVLLGNKLYSGEISRPFGTTNFGYGLCLHEVVTSDNNMIFPCNQFNLRISANNLYFRNVSISDIFDKGGENLVITSGYASTSSTTVNISSQIIRGDSN